MNFGKLFIKKTKIRENPNKIQEIYEEKGENEKDPHDIINFAYLGDKKINIELIEKINPSNTNIRKVTKKQIKEVDKPKSDITIKELTEILNKNINSGDQNRDTSTNFNNSENGNKYSIDKKIFKLYELFNKFHNKEIANILTKTEILKRRSMELIESDSKANESDKLKQVLENVFNLDNLEKKVKGKRKLKIDMIKKKLQDKIFKKPISSKIKKYIQDKFLFYQEDINQNHINNLINDIVKDNYIGKNKNKNSYNAILEDEIDISSSDGEYDYIKYTNTIKLNKNSIFEKGENLSKYPNGHSSNKNSKKLTSGKSLNYSNKLDNNHHKNKTDMNESFIYSKDKNNHSKIPPISDTTIRKFHSFDNNNFNNNLNILNESRDILPHNKKNNINIKYLNILDSNKQENLSHDININRINNLYNQTENKSEEINLCREGKNKESVEKINDNNLINLQENNQKLDILNSINSKRSVGKKNTFNCISHPYKNISQEKENINIINSCNFLKKESDKNLNNNLNKNSLKKRSVRLTPLNFSLFNEQENIDNNLYQDNFNYSNDRISISNINKYSSNNLEISNSLPSPTGNNKIKRGIDYKTHGIDENRLFSYLKEFTKNTKGKFLNYKESIVYKTIEEFFDNNSTKINKNDQLNFNETQKTKIFLNSLMSIGHALNKSTKENINNINNKDYYNESKFMKYNIDLESDIANNRNIVNLQNNVKTQNTAYNSINQDKFIGIKNSTMSKIPFIYTKYSLNDYSSDEENEKTNTKFGNNRSNLRKKNRNTMNLVKTNDDDSSDSKDDGKIKLNQ